MGERLNTGIEVQEVIIEPRDVYLVDLMISEGCRNTAPELIAGSKAGVKIVYEPIERGSSKLSK